MDLDLEEGGGQASQYKSLMAQYSLATKASATPAMMTGGLKLDSLCKKETKVKVQYNNIEVEPQDSAKRATGWCE